MLSSLLFAKSDFTDVSVMLCYQIKLFLFEKKSTKAAKKGGKRKLNLTTQIKSVSLAKTPSWKYIYIYTCMNSSCRGCIYVADMALQTLSDENQQKNILSSKTRPWCIC